MDCPVCQNKWDSQLRVPRILKCGHSNCEQCVKEILTAGQLVCIQCSAYQQFQVERNFDETDQDFIKKCVSSLSKNYTLLSLVYTEQTKTKKSEKSVVCKQKSCPDHNLPLHSYTPKPYSLLCDLCIEEIAEYKLRILPIPQVVSELRLKLEQAQKVVGFKGNKIKRLLDQVTELTSNKQTESLERLEAHFANLKK